MSIDKKTLRNIFLGLVGCILLVWVLYDWERVSTNLNVLIGVLSPFFLGAGIAFVFNVPMRGFENILIDIRNAGLRRVFAVILTVLSFVLVIMLVFWLLIPQLVATFQTLVPKVYEFVMALEAKLDQFLSENPELMKELEEKIKLRGKDIDLTADDTYSLDEDDDGSEVGDGGEDGDDFDIRLLDIENDD